MRHGRFLIFPLVLVVGALALAPAAGAKVFWGNQDTLDGGNRVLGSVGRANTDGTRVDQDLVPNQDGPCAVATDGRHVYWASRNGTVGRANVDGSDANSEFITGIKFNCGQIAVDSEHIYWTQGDSAKPAIGRAELDSSNVDTNWLPLAAFPLGMAIDSQHVYWTARPSKTSNVADVGRANIDGTGMDAHFIQGTRELFFLAVDSAHVYAAPLLGPAILRANLDGTRVDPNFIQIPSQAPACGIAADDSHIYWGAFGKRGNAVARANLDGTRIEPSFITGGRSSCGVAVAPDAAPTPGLTLGEVRHHVRRGTATLLADVTEPGRLVIRGKGLQTKLRSPLRARRVKLPVKPKGGKKRLLERNGVVKVRARVVFHSRCGCREVDRRTIRLKKST